MKISRTTILAVVAVLVIAFLSGIRVAHPKEGLSNALGSAKSVLVVYRNADNIAVGNKVIATLEAPNASPVLALVNATADATVDLQIGAKLARVKHEQISGKLLAVIPFLGSVVGIFGL